MSRNRMVALVAVGLIHVLLGYALITGLASKALKVITEPLKTVNIKEQEKPPEEPPPPPPKDIEIPPFVPPPEVTIDSPPVPTITTQTTIRQPDPPKYVAPQVVAPQPPPQVAPSIAPTAAIPKGRGNTITDDDYPEASKRAEEQGISRVSYTVGTDGKATACSVVTSSGSTRLDETACKLVERRFRFTPATREGKPVTEVKQQAIRWQIRNDK